MTIMEPKVFCSSCQAHIPEVQAYYAEIDEEGYYFCDYCWEEQEDPDDWELIIEAYE